MARTDAQRSARKRYDKRCKRLVVTVYPTEPEIMARVTETPEGYGPYIKRLILEDIRRNG